LQDHARGDLWDFALKDLLRELTAQNAGLVLCTTRVRLSEVPDDAGRAESIPLDNLSEPDGAQYLREKFRVQGAEADLREASRAYGNHALALTLLGTYLEGGDVSLRHEIRELPIPDDRPGRQARRVMQSHAERFAGQPEEEILKGLGYFDRPAEPEALKLVLPTIDARTYREALRRLAKARLILAEDDADVDCHPLVREHLGAVRKATDPEAFRAGHSRLYEYYCTKAKHQPDTLAEMTPLFHAVGHGCQAGRHQEACENVYRDRIRRGGANYLIHQLGAPDYHLAMARRHQSQQHLEKAAALIQETGYHRRDPELAALRLSLS